jgi:hypothetical protein
MRGLCRDRAAHLSGCHIPGGPLLDLSPGNVVPHQVIVGRVHRPAAVIIEKRLAIGKIIATTFRLQADAARNDPVAEALHDGLLQMTTRPQAILPTRLPSDTLPT